MRALEITLFSIGVLLAPTMFAGLGIINGDLTQCDATVCQAQQFLYDMADNSKLQTLNLNQSDPVSMGWDLLTFSLTFVIFAFFWMMYILSLVVLIGPAFAAMFGVPDAMVLYINVFYWLLWMLAIIQYKRGGFSVDAYK
mgnify:CR=1 FL=1